MFAAFPTVPTGLRRLFVLAPVLAVAAVAAVVRGAASSDADSGECASSATQQLTYTSGELRDLEYFARELLKMKELMGLKPNMVFADVGAFDGKYTIPLAYEVLPYGKAYATDVVEGGEDGEGDLKWRGIPYGTNSIKARVDEANVCAQETCTSYSLYTRSPKINVSAVLAKDDDVGLPAGELDAIMLRTSYHHLIKPLVALHQFDRALKPGGRLLIIDNNAQDGPDSAGVPENRAGMGIDPRIILDELATTLPHFTLEQQLSDWVAPTRFGGQYAFLYVKPG